MILREGEIEGQAWKTISDETFLWLQNNFLENRFAPKTLNKKLFVADSHTSKFFDRNIFMVPKSFLRKLVLTKYFDQNFWWKIFNGCEIVSLKKNFLPKIFIKIVLVQSSLWLQNHFLENRILIKIFINIFSVKIFLWLQNHLLENRFLPKNLMKIFIVVKSFPR